MKVLITGASGFLGSHVAELLSKRGTPVRALVRKTSNTSFLRTLENVELCNGAVEDRDSLGAAMDGVTHVLHSAGAVRARGPEEFMRINARGTENLLEAALEHRSEIRRFVYVSSQTVAGPSEAGEAIREDATPRPVTHYGRSKLEAERLVLARKDELPVTVLRPAAIYGPRDKEILIFFKSIKTGVLPLTNPVQGKLSMIFGEDCATACIATLDSDVQSGSIYFLDDGEVYTFGDLIRMAEDAIGHRAWLRIPLPRSVVLGAAAASEAYGRITDQAVMFTRDKCNELFGQWVCDSSKAREELAWTPQVKFAEGVRRTIDWYRRAGWL
jgi:nucleoside-diphosphate-sugar epimerase